MGMDEFVFDPTIFDKPTSQYRKRRAVVKTYDDMGMLLSKTCTDCDVEMGVGHFSGKMSFCKECICIRDIKYRNTPYGFVMKMVKDAKKIN